MGSAVAVLFQSVATNSLTYVLKTILPFMALVSALIGIIMAFSGLGDWTPTARAISQPSTGAGDALAALTCSFPLLSPFLGPSRVYRLKLRACPDRRSDRPAISPASGASRPSPRLTRRRPAATFYPGGRPVTGGSEQDTVRVGVPSVLSVGRFLTGAPTQ